MAKVTEQVSPRMGPVIRVVPWGIDTSFFEPGVEKAPSDTLVVGTVKTLEHKYGIDLLIRAFAEARAALPAEVAQRMRLLLVGGGSLERELEALAAQVGVAEVTEFRGQVPFERVPSCLRELDIYVAASRSESFGVAILEASACGRPVVVAAVGGLPEVVRDAHTGIVVPREDVGALAGAILRLVRDESLRAQMGAAGREHVKRLYEWKDCVDLMEGVYAEFV
jgi:glycosyltransferase involved in cell wall biosynthesis